jgi:hypothetical protein
MALARVHQRFRTRDLPWKQLPLRLTIDATTAPDKQRLAESDSRPSRQDAFARQLTSTLLLAAPTRRIEDISPICTDLSAKQSGETSVTVSREKAPSNRFAESRGPDYRRA